MSSAPKTARGGPAAALSAAGAATLRHPAATGPRGEGPDPGRLWDVEDGKWRACCMVLGCFGQPWLYHTIHIKPLR